MNIQIGSKVVVTTNNWFFGADGVEYRGVYGTVKAVRDDEQTLGIKTNRNATNWYLEIGGMVIAGCQIYYVCLCNDPPAARVTSFREHEGKVIEYERPSVIYNADAQP